MSVSVKKTRAKAWGLSWEVDYRQPDGRRRRKRFATREQADDHASSVRKRIKKGSYCDPNNVGTFGEAALEWLAEKEQEADVDTGTLAYYETHLHRHLFPEIGDLKLDEISTRRLLSLRRQLMKRLSLRTTTKIMATAKNVFAYALENETIDSNPAAALRRNRVGNGSNNSLREVSEEEVLYTGEVGRLLKATADGDPLYDVVIMVAALTGMRVNEILGLMWKHIDLKEGQIQVRQSLTWRRRREDRETGWRLKIPKSKRSRRQIDVPKGLLAKLRQWKLRCERSGPEDFVFGGSDGAPIHHGKVLREGLYPALKRAGINRVTMHGLRHSFASRLLAQKRAITEVSAILGHANTHITATVYAHWLGDEKTTTMQDAEDAVMSVAEGDK